MDTFVKRNELLVLTVIVSGCEHIRNVLIKIKDSTGEWSNETISGCIERKQFGGKTAIEIHVKNQHIPKLDKDSIKHLVFLDILEIKNCGVESIVPGVFRNLQAIRVVEITHNPRLRNIVEGVFSSFNTIQILRLHHNGIETIANKALSNMTLHEVDLSYNKLRKFDPDWFDDFSNITQLYFQNNRITKLPSKAFDTMETLEDINFDNNDISEIGPEAFRKLKKLRSLLLKNNKLMSINDDIFPNNIYIETFDIRGNYLHNLSSNVMNQLTVKEVILNYNPWLCSCEKHLSNWLLLQKAVLKNPDNCNLNYLPVCVGFFNDECKKPEDFTELLQNYLEIFKSMPSVDKKCAGLEQYADNVIQ